mmetsp:Transcript_17941/g.53914  ORF Transcript_17941/g.53914 Transcript_17941/m.53914 type:complete len:253 (-) Transcript_17941:427-1185(-)
MTSASWSICVRSPPHRCTFSVSSWTPHCCALWPQWHAVPAARTYTFAQTPASCASGHCDSISSPVPPQLVSRSRLGRLHHLLRRQLHRLPRPRLKSTQKRGRHPSICARSGFRVCGCRERCVHRAARRTPPRSRSGSSRTWPPSRTLSPLNSCARCVIHPAALRPRSLPTRTVRRSQVGPQPPGGRALVVVSGSTSQPCSLRTALSSASSSCSVCSPTNDSRSLCSCCVATMMILSGTVLVLVILQVMLVLL